MSIHEERSHHSYTQYKITVAAINIKVKFACRLFMEYSSGATTNKTKQLRIDPKTQIYQYNEEILWGGSNKNGKSDKGESLIIIVKLLSNRGLQFTAGNIKINEKDVLIGSNQRSFEISKNKDIQVICTLKFENYEEGTLINGLDSIKEEAQQTSKLEVQQEKANKQEEHFYNAELPQFSRVHKNIKQKHQKVNSRREQSAKKCVGTDHQDYINKTTPIRNSGVKRVVENERQNMGYSHLYQRQKEMINLLQKKYKEALNHQDRLKINLNKCELQLQKKRQKINDLQEDRIRLLKNNVQQEKKLLIFKDSIKILIEKTHSDILTVLTKANQKKQKQTLGFKITNSIIKKEDTQTPLKLLQNRHVETESQECSEVEDMTDFSASNCPDSHIASHQQFSEKEYKQSQLHSLKMQGCFQLQDFLKQLNHFCSNLTQEVSKYASKLCSQLFKMSKSNTSVKMKLKETRQHFENSQESLFSYLQELENSLERQLEITNQKQQAILGYLAMIEDLTDKLNEQQLKIKQLQEQNIKLTEQKEFIKSQLHGNNYMFSIKQQELLRKIQALENHMSLYNPHQHLSLLPIDLSDTHQTDKLDPPTYSQSLIGEYCQRLRDKQMQLLFEKKQKQRLLDLLENREEELRFALLQKRKMEFAIKLKEKMTGSDGEIEKSFEMTERQLNNDEHMQQQFLKILT